MTWDLGDQGAGKTALRLGLAKMMYHEEQWKPCETVADMFSTYDNGLLIDKKFIYLNELSTIDKKIAAKLRKVVSERERTYKALYENKIQGFDLATYTASPATPRSRRSSRPVKKPRLMTVRRGGTGNAMGGEARRGWSPCSSMSLPSFQSVYFLERQFCTRCSVGRSSPLLVVS